MKSILSLVHLPILFACLLVFNTGCKKDNTLDREKFLGTYNVAETCDTYTDSYNITISASNSGDDKVVISNLYDAGDLLSGSVNSSSLVITNQTLNGVTYSGGGTYGSNDILVINFILSGGSYSENCTALCTKL